MRLPSFFFTANRFPPQSGKYTASSATVGVADTSPPVVNTHFGESRFTFAGLIKCSAGWLQVLLRFWPAMRHWSDWDVCDEFCAFSDTPNRSRLTSVIIEKDNLPFVDIHISLSSVAVMYISSGNCKR